MSGSKRKNRGSRKAEAVGLQNENFFVKTKRFFIDAKDELLRVVWPTKEATIKSTGVLLVLVAIAAAYLSVADMIISFVLKLVI